MAKKRGTPKKVVTPQKAGKKKVPPTPPSSTKKQEDVSIATVSELLYTPIKDLVDDLVGVPIRKCFGPRRWQTGVITALCNDNSICRVDYNNDGNTTIDDDGSILLPQEEELPVDQELERWIIAHAMYSLSPSEVDEADNDNKYPALFKRSANQEPYTLSELKDLLTYTSKIHGGASMKDIEDSKLVGMKKTSEKCEVYGRMLPGAFDKIQRLHLKLKKEHCFLDIGHGIGNTCIQAAYTVGCEARGIESDKGRNAVGEIMAIQLEDAVSIHKERDGMKFQPGDVSLICGYLQDYHKHRHFMTTGVNRILFDNWDGVFTGERYGTLNLEKFVAAWFAMAPEGTVMCTVSPLRATLGCLPLSEANATRKKYQLEPSNLASYYEMEEHELGTKGQVYSFSEGRESCNQIITCYRYVRTAQNGSAVFLCNNLQCQRGNDIPIPAVKIEPTGNNDGEHAAVIATCGCNFSARVMRKRKTTEDCQS